jgi:hypothetical protein
VALAWHAWSMVVQPFNMQHSPGFEVMIHARSLSLVSLLRLATAELGVEASVCWWAGGLVHEQLGGRDGDRWGSGRVEVEADVGVGEVEVDFQSRSQSRAGQPGHYR